MKVLKIIVVSEKIYMFDDFCDVNKTKQHKPCDMETTK